MALLLLAAIFGLRVAFATSEDAVLVLLVVPIALCAIQFGARGGLAAALVAVAVLAGCELSIDQGVGLLRIASHTTAFALAGWVLGRFVDKRRALAARISQHYDLSLDLFCTASFDGYFEEVNPAWQEVFGYTPAELRSRPFIDFVHPDDRASTEAEAAKLAAHGGSDTVSFRNRYRAANGEYHWLEWKSRAVETESRIYATARDITAQQLAEGVLQNESDFFERTVRERTHELEESRLETLQRLAAAAEYRDDDTQQHAERVGRTAALIARELTLPDDAVALIRRAAPLHDLGKLGVSDAILLKPGKLTDAEFEAMQEHTTIGAGILGEGKSPVLCMAREIALAHHERWDGSGYPLGAYGDTIPLAGRIVAVADVFDALTHDRPYKRAWTVAAAACEIERVAGTHFDPDVVEAFATLEHHLLVEPVGEFDIEGLHLPNARPRTFERQLAAPALV